jgi:hypothetical protein
MAHPAHTITGSCSGSCIQTYVYDATTGLLDTLGHPSASGGTLTTTFSYDTQLRLTTTAHPGAVSTIGVRPREPAGIRERRGRATSWCTTSRTVS